jgi:hypothetical protein
MKHGNQPNGIFVGNYLREQPNDLAEAIYNLVCPLKGPTKEMFIDFLMSLGFIHLDGDSYAHDKRLMVEVYIFKPTQQLTISFRGHDADTALDLKRRYAFARELANYPFPLSTY